MLCPESLPPSSSSSSESEEEQSRSRACPTSRRDWSAVTEIHDADADFVITVSHASSPGLVSEEDFGGGKGEGRLIDTWRF